MGSKLATIIGMFFFFMAVLFSTDLIMLNVTYSSLNSAASNCSIIFSNKGGINAKTEVEDYLKTLFAKEVKLTFLSDSSARDTTFIFNLSTEYQPIFIRQEPINVSVTRSTYIGNYQI